VDYQCSSEWLQQLQDRDSEKEEQHRKVSCFFVYESLIMFFIDSKSYDRIFSFCMLLC
jgi:hypothetical protein